MTGCERDVVHRSELQGDVGNSIAPALALGFTRLAFTGDPDNPGLTSAAPR
jgi:hypothetical protein